jgi:hypothetical protein
VSRRLSSWRRRITDKVIEEMNDWCNRPLYSVYAAIFVHAIVVKVRHGHGHIEIARRIRASTGSFFDIGQVEPPPSDSAVQPSRTTRRGLDGPP